MQYWQIVVKSDAMHWRGNNKIKLNTKITKLSSSNLHSIVGYKSKDDN